MNRIDFIGPPGSGKTALYRELLKKRSLSKSLDWFTPEEVELKIARKLILDGRFVGIKNIIKLFLSYLPGFGWMRYLLFKSTIGLIDREILWQDKLSYNPFLTLAKEAFLLTQSEPIRAFWDIGYIMDLCKNISVCEHFFKTNNLVIYEDSLSQRASSLMSFQIDTNFIESYFKSLPQPTGIVYFKISPEELLKRIKQRHKIILKHKGLTDKEIYDLSVLEIKNCDLAVKKLALVGVPVLTVDTGLEIGDTADIINNYLKNIIHEKSN